MNEKHIDVVGLGASTIDLITVVEHFPARREAQQALAMAIQGGGPVATAIVAAARLGGKAAMIDSIGDDWAGKLVLQDFQMEGIGTDTIEVQRGHTTSTSNILVSAEDGARAIMFLPASVPELRLSESQKHAIRSARMIHLNGRHWQACLEAIELAKQHDVRISFDGGANRFKPEMKALLPLTDICIVAQEFAERYTEEADLSKSAELFLEEGPEIAAVTNGSEGSWICTKEGLSFHQPAFLFPKTVDTTGCGDSYHGAFLAGLLKGFTVRQAATLASAVAGMNTQSLGGRAGIPDLARVTEYLFRNGIPLE